MNKIGKLITLTGIDGSGKTCQISCLNREFRKRGIKIKCMHLKTIDSTQYFAGAVSRMKNYINIHNITNRSEIRNILSAYLFIEKVENEVVPALLKYEVVLIDRYIDSAMCYHYLHGALSSNIIEIYNSCEIVADINFYLKVSVTECIKRMEQRTNKNEFETQEYLLMAEKYYNMNAERFFIIDGQKTIAEITSDLWKECEKLI